MKGTGKNRQEENRWDEKEREEEEGKPLLSFAVSTRSRGRVVRNIRPGIFRCLTSFRLFTDL